MHLKAARDGAADFIFQAATADGGFLLFKTLIRTRLKKTWLLWAPASVVFGAGVLASAAVVSALLDRQDKEEQSRADQEVELFVASLQLRMSTYADLLMGMQPIFETSSTNRSRRAFMQKTMVEHLVYRYPGIASLAVSRHMLPDEYLEYRDSLIVELSEAERVPLENMPAWDPQRKTYNVLDQVWPDQAASVLVGSDASIHSAAQLHAHHSASRIVPRMTEPLHLRQLPHGTNAVLISVPFQRIEPDGPRLIGTVNLGVRMDTLIEDLHGQGLLRNTVISLSDVGSVVPGHMANTKEQPLYVSLEWGGVQPGIQRVREFELLGRSWRLDYASRPQVLSSAERFYPWVVGALGFLMTLLLASMLALAARQRERALLKVQAKHNLLRHRTGRLNALFHQHAIGVAEVNAVTGQFLHVNARFCEIAGELASSLNVKGLLGMLQDAGRRACEQALAQLRDGEQGHHSQVFQVQRADGSAVWAEMWLAPLPAQERELPGSCIVLLQDVSQRHRMQQQLQARESYSSEMLRYMPVGFVVVGVAGNIEFINHQFEVMTGWQQADMPDESSMWRTLCVDTLGHARLLQRLAAVRSKLEGSSMSMLATDYLLRAKDGRELPVEVSGRFLDGRVLLSFVDVSQRKEAEAQIRWLGYYDTLTQLPNRRLLLDRLQEALVRSEKGGGSRGALLLLDIDNFKALNETLGHEHGDALLRLVATRLSGCIAGRHTLARQGGDEFAVVLEDLPMDPLEAGRSTEQVGGTILAALRTPFYLNEQDFHVTVSMGAVVFCGQNDSVEELLKHAELALYQAKSAGRDSLQFFDPSMQQAVSARVEMEKDIRLALERHEFDLFYQPQVCEGRVTGAEALLRWQHPSKGLISPAVFVPAAEDSGLILPLGEWVLYAACRQLAHWVKDPVLSQISMSVNVSPRQFYQPDFVSQVEQALKVSGARPELLELELTEGMLLEDVEDTIRKMVQLKALGVSFSLDDFGTGYSSLSYLKRLPLDKLKIDQGFVREVVTSSNDAAIARSIIALGNSLGLQVIAEGVETEAQRAFLAENGCSFWQGYLFSRPLPVADFERWARSYSAEMENLHKAALCP